MIKISVRITIVIYKSYDLLILFMNLMEEESVQVTVFTVNTPLIIHKPQE